MWIALCIAAFLICVVLILRLISQNRDLRSAARQLRERREHDSTTKLNLVSPNASAEELLAAVNDLSAYYQQERAAFVQREQGLRRQIANMSHDLRTPLTSISGYLQLLEAPGMSEQERQEYLTVVKSRAQTLGVLISAFYDLSRIESGDYPLDCKPVLLAPPLRRLLAEEWSDFSDAGIAINAELNETVPPVWADENAVLRIFTNLLGNAGKYAVGSLTVALYRKDNWVITSFSNPAPGLTEEDAAHVLERSYTGDKMRSNRSTGLGLAIVKALAERMGHRVSARWEKGIFTIEVMWRCANG